MTTQPSLCGELPCDKNGNLPSHGLAGRDFLIQNGVLLTIPRLTERKRKSFVCATLWGESGSHGFATVSSAVAVGATTIRAVRLPEVHRAETEEIAQRAGILIFQREKFFAG